MDDLYLILGVEPNVKPDVIQERFRFLAQAYHPDKFSSQKQKELAEEEFKKINYAYQILSNPNKRSDYDLRRRSTVNYSRTDTNNVNRNVEEVARQRAQAEQTRKAEEAARQRLRAEQIRNAEEAARLHLWAEKLRKDEEAARHHARVEQLRKVKEAEQQRIKAEQKRRLTETARQRALIKQKEKEYLLELCLKHHLIQKDGDHYIVNPSGSEMSAIIEMPHVDYPREHADLWYKDYKERKRKLRAFLRGISKKEAKEHRPDSEQQDLHQSIGTKAKLEKGAAGNSPAITSSEIAKAWKQIMSSVIGESAHLAALMNSVKVIDVQGSTLVLYFATEIVKSKMDTEEKERTRKAVYDTLGVALDVRCEVWSRHA